MTCPVCTVTLRSTDPHKVPIHYCPECGGVWLEHRTIHEILERSRAGIQAVLAGKRPPRTRHGHARRFRGGQ